MVGLKPGAVLYAKDIELVSGFYQLVVGLTVTCAENDHVVLASENIELVILRIPESLAQSITIENPPKRRTETPIKLVFPVGSISDARSAAGRSGGELNPPEREWTYRGCLVCDGQDPEGNVFQVRQNAP